MTPHLKDAIEGAERGGHRPLSEINVTPFVDVMLVLLVIFMVTAPLMTVGIKVTLPKVSTAPAALPQEPVVVSVDAQGRLFLKSEALDDQAFQAQLRAMAAVMPDRVVLVRGDAGLNYGRLVAVMDLVTRAGFTRVSLAAEGRAPGQADRAPP